MRILPPGFKEKGFTLIEVMIAILLLALMSIAVYQVTTRSFSLNAQLGQESTDYIAIVLSLQNVETDLSQIYTPPLDPALAPKDPNSQASQFWSAPLRSDGMRRSRLQGSKEKITFLSNGNRRVEEDSPQSDFQKVTWEIERNAEGAYSLYRSTDWDAFNVDDGVAAKPIRVALLENLTSAKFTYYRTENKTWDETWDSEGRFVKPEARFPQLISLKVELPDPMNNANNQTWEVVVRPNFPLNGDSKKTGREATN
jgi:type II secretion system protein J